MANFKTYSARKTTVGPGRVAVTASVIGTDPTGVAQIMDTNFAFVSSPIAWIDMGATANGITMTKSYAEQTYSHDLSGGTFKTEITEHTMAVEYSLAETGDIEKFVYAWMADDTTTQNSTDRIKGIAARRVVPHRSFVGVEIDENSNLRAFYLREVANQAGDSAFNLAPGALHVLPVKLTAFQDPTKSGKEFGFIDEQGVDSTHGFGRS